MRFGKSFVIYIFLIVPISLLTAQQSAPQVTSALQSSLSAMIGTDTVQDVTLSGSVERIAGGEDETGSVQLVATATGLSRIDLQLPSGSRAEARSVTPQGTPIGVWSAADGVQHPIARNNLLTTASWFFPAILVKQLVSSQTSTVSYVGQETRNGATVLHFTAYSIPGIAVSAALPSLQHRSQMDLYLDAASFLPVSLIFNVHPDSDQNIDVPVEIRFSNYQASNGIRLPFRVQKFINNGLNLDFQIQSAAFNSGVQLPTITAQ